MLQNKQGTSLFDKARNIAEYYGFNSLEAILKEAREKSGIKKVKFGKMGGEFPGEADKVSIMRAYIDYNLQSLPQPLFIYHSEPLPKSMERSEYGGKSGVLFSLEIIGSTKSVAEATLFKTGFSIIKDAGFEKVSVTINSLGDRDSINKFVRDFTLYYKKRTNEVPSHCRNLLKKDVFKVLECSQEKCMLVKEHAPKPITSLSEESRKHFHEVLEFLESMDVEYSINNCLVGGKDYYTQTVFEIKTEDEKNHLYPKSTFKKLLGRGGRFDDLSKKLGGKREIPSVGLSISLGGLGLCESKKAPKIVPRKSMVYLIHLGFTAKQKSLSALEVLRKAKIAVYQSLSRDRISTQVATAEKMNVPYTIIIGHKEALEDTAIVRNMENRSQETVPIGDLPGYLKKIRS